METSEEIGAADVLGEHDDAGVELVSDIDALELVLELESQNCAAFRAVDVFHSISPLPLRFWKVRSALRIVEIAEEFSISVSARLKFFAIVSHLCIFRALINIDASSARQIAFVSVFTFRLAADSNWLAKMATFAVLAAGSDVAGVDANAAFVDVEALIVHFFETESAVALESDKPVDANLVTRTGIELALVDRHNAVVDAVAFVSVVADARGSAKTLPTGSQTAFGWHT